MTVFATTPDFRSHWKLLQNRGAFQNLLLLADLVATQLHKSSPKSFLYVSPPCCSEWLLMLSFSIQNSKFLKCHSVHKVFNTLLIVHLKKNKTHG